MSLIKVADVPRPCTHGEHNPPSMIVLPPGVYEHQCPGCGKKQRFTVYGGPTMTTRPTNTGVDFTSAKPTFTSA